MFFKYSGRIYQGDKYQPPKTQYLKKKKDNRPTFHRNADNQFFMTPPGGNITHFPDLFSVKCI